MKTLAEPSDQAEIRTRLKNLRADSRGRWGHMTANEMVCHLADSFRILLDRKTTKPFDNWFTRTILKAVALQLPARWPPGIRTAPELDQRIGGTKPVAFAADVAELEALMSAIVAAPATLDRRPHPLFGPMSSAEWLRWGYLHMDHHLRQFGA